MNFDQQWHSEYESRCEELRNKQRELQLHPRMNPIAGVATTTHEAIPTFYAWEGKP
jgi:hypothetical protein